MANGIKTYQIKINGVTESIDAVKSLNEQLKSLEDRIKALESKSIGVKATSSTGGGSKSSSTETNKSVGGKENCLFQGNLSELSCSERCSFRDCKRPKINCSN